MCLYLAFKPDTAASTENAFAAVELCVQYIRAWMLCDKLKINDGKTDFILIGMRQQLLKVHVNSLAIGDVQVSSVMSVKNLGTWMDSNLNLQVNINNTCKAAYYHLTNIRRIRKYLDENAAQKLIHTIIIGRIDYCNGILYGLPATQIIKLQRLQDAAARLVLNIPLSY